ncbi:DUF2933 domain-containing protein [Siccirubricoccus phaeus]
MEHYEHTLGALPYLLLLACRRCSCSHTTGTVGIGRTPRHQRSGPARR